MNINTLNILADAISEVGSWHWWLVRDDMVQVQFCDVMLYDDETEGQETRTTEVLALRFRGNTFAVFADNLDEDNWHERFLEDNATIYPVDTYELAFDNIEDAERLLEEYARQTVIKDFFGSQTLSAANHLLCAKCGDVAFVVGGDTIEVVGRNKKYTEEDIAASSEKWWAYWREYWKVRGSKDAYPKDYACEITIPVREG